MNRSKVLPLLLLLAAPLFQWGCGGSKDNVHDSVVVKNDSPQVNDSTQAKYQRLISNIPIPLDILQKLSSSGVSYRDSLVNPVANLSNYSNSNTQAMNLGIYGADLTYVISMEQFGEVGGHIKAVKKLADVIVIPTAFDQSMMDRYNNNRNNRDSLADMIYQSYRRIDATLKSNERIGLAALVVTGGWVESLYLTTQHMTRDKDGLRNKTLLKTFFDQQQHLTNLISLLAEFRNDTYITQIKDALTDLKTIYPTNGKCDTDVLSKIAAKLAAIRTMAVNGQ